MIFVRHRRATGLQRTQLRWLLWAAIICAILVAVSLLVPTSLITYIALFAAVIATSASIAAGICRPDLVDIDGLVAGTVVYAGVAGCVVILDFAVLAATSGLLGDRLDQREITWWCCCSRSRSTDRCATGCPASSAGCWSAGAATGTRSSRRWPPGSKPRDGSKINFRR